MQRWCMQQAGQAMQAYSAWQPKEFDAAPGEAEPAPGQENGSTAESQSGFVYDSTSGEIQVLRCSHA